MVNCIRWRHGMGAGGRLFYQAKSCLNYGGWHTDSVCMLFKSVYVLLCVCVCVCVCECECVCVILTSTICVTCLVSVLVSSCDWRPVA